jgi:hypothetical protein
VRNDLRFLEAVLTRRVPGSFRDDGQSGTPGNAPGAPRSR